ncbi:MAG TPA: hypothetical protein VFK09_11615 [Gemmatimonadales bacterium]|nr:hypothetical protein [Gemmatimonadales bacterium]
MSPLTRTLLRLQAVYYLATGLWPVASITTFEMVTGPKTDEWLVRMVGLLAAVIGLAVGVAAGARRLTPELLVLSIGSALAFAAIDLFYALAGVIAPVYLGDAVLQLGGVTLLAWSVRRTGVAAR